MLNPIAAAYNAFLGFLSCLPQPFIAFMFLVIGCWIILAIIKVILS